MNGRRLIAVFACMVLLLSLSACKKNGSGKIEDGVYTDKYQSVAQENYDDMTVKIRTSSSAYFPGSVIAITAVIENESDKYYAVAPFGEGFEIKVIADGYELEMINTGAQSEVDIIETSQSDTASKTDAVPEEKEKKMLILEPHGSVSITKEFMTNAIVNGNIVPLWECEAAAQLSVEIGKGCESKELAMKSTEFESKTAKSTFNVYGTGNKPN